MHAGELWLSARCAACGSVATDWSQCSPVDHHMNRCSTGGHLHYECSRCGYRGTVVPTTEEQHWIAAQLALIADHKPTQLPTDSVREIYPTESPQ